MISEIKGLMSLSVTEGSSGSSEAAKWVASQRNAGKLRLQQTYSLGLRGSQAFEELELLASECSSVGWDGYSAAAVLPSTVHHARLLLRALPLGTAAPSFGAEPDGHITLEWYRSPRYTLSISVSPDAQLHYSAILGASKCYGTEPFFGGIPRVLLELIGRFEPQHKAGAA